jgi:hypothetical protein
MNSNLTDEEIEAAFENTNFGTTKYREILVEGVRKTVLGQHNGWTMTTIIRNLGFGVPNKKDGNKVTKLGLEFLINNGVRNENRTD